MNIFLNWAIRVSLVFAAIMLFVLLMNTIAKAQEPLGDHVRWGLHPALGVVLEYRIDNEDVYYAHQVLLGPAPYPECKGQVGNPLGHPHCAFFRLAMGEIILVHVEDGMPIIYIVELIPSHKRVNGGDFESLIQATWGQR